MTRLPWTLCASEFLGTALLVGVGVSLVILDFAQGSPVSGLIRDPGMRRAITGFFFGSTGALIALSPLGRASGAHINPVVTLAFWVRRRIGARHALAYVLAQLAGGIAGALPLLCWGSMGASVDYGATLPGPAYGTGFALAGEAATTFALVALLFLFLGHSRLRSFTPLLFPILYGAMVYLEAPLSGTSTNPARSLGPEVISGNWADWWVYWVGPVAGALTAAALHRLAWPGRLEIDVAKMYHFEHDPHGIFGAWHERKAG